MDENMLLLDMMLVFFWLLSLLFAEYIGFKRGARRMADKFMEMMHEEFVENLKKLVTQNKTPENNRKKKVRV
jgi:inner membrane protein involved in colicin E2 resistance